MERSGLINQTFKLSDDELIDYFIHIYRYFDNKGYFNSAKKGVWFSKPFSEDIQILAPTLAPSPEVYFLNHLQDSQIWPIYEYAPDYTNDILFTVIEILYDHIAFYDYENEELIKEKPRSEFAEYINNILKMYGDGYYLESTQGFIMKLPNKALKHQLSYNGEDMPSDVFKQLSAATNMYYRFDANLEEKKKAINILADIYEKERIIVKELFNQEYELSKNGHDKLFFGVVNEFNIRHNRADQKTEYSREIWYEWMMQYYTSVIIAFYKLKKEIE